MTPPLGKYVHLALLTAIGILISGCATSSSNLRLPKGTPVHVEVTSKDVLYAAGMVNESGLEGFKNRVAKYICEGLAKRGVDAKSAPVEVQKAQLVVNIGTIEVATGHKPGPFFSTISFPEMKVKYDVSLTSSAGAALQYSDAVKHQGIDEVARKIGSQVADRARSRMR